MAKVTKAYKDEKINEILNSCLSLYLEKDFSDITLIEIGQSTSLTRTSIYNYFKTKEEIFLELLNREYVLYQDDLKKMALNKDNLNLISFANELALNTSKRFVMLKILSTNFYELENSCSLGSIVRFKKTYFETLNEISICLKHYFNDISQKQIDEFIYSFFPFLFGVYPYTSISPKFIKAMSIVGIKHKDNTIYELVYNHVLNILKGSFNL